MAAVAIRLIGPRLPLILKTTLLHSLSLTEESAVWDLRTAIIITTLRSILSGTPSSYERQQNFTLRDSGIMGGMWISKVTLPLPEDGLDHLVFDVIDELKANDSETYAKPALVAVEAEWTGFRAGVGSREPEPNLTEEEKYSKLMNEVESDTTILYVHGGAYYLCDPSSHRRSCSKLAQLTKGRVLSIRYRLAPQHPFPAALLDCLVAYLSLLYPAKESRHEPVSPKNIVFAGDSAGGNMCLVMILLLLHLQKTGRKSLRWHGQDVEIPLPAAVATNSAWCDITRSMPSILSKAHFDYLPPPLTRLRPDGPPPPESPACNIWPATPPRANLYCDGGMLCHPLISPLGAPAEMWHGAPPLFFCCGEEMLDDEIRILAQRCHGAGVKVRYETFEAMPHCFAMILDWRTPRSARCFDGWAEFIRSSIAFANRDSNNTPDGLTGGYRIEYKSGKETELDLRNLTLLEDIEVHKLMEAEKANINKLFEESLSKGESRL